MQAVRRWKHVKCVPGLYYRPSHTQAYAHSFEPSRFAERNFRAGFDDVTHQLSGISRAHGRSPLRRDGPSPERVAELSRLDSFKAADWIALTGVGLGTHGHYRISIEGVKFIEWTDEEREAEGLTADDQEQMLRDNETPALTFPCTAEELIAFADQETPDGTRFELPSAFRQSILERRSFVGESERSMGSQTSVLCAMANPEEENSELPLSVSWKDSARKIADELFDHDTKLDSRDSLDGYSRRVLDAMQKRGIHGPRGRITNHNTIKRDALSGNKWWQKKVK